MLTSRIHPLWPRRKERIHEARVERARQVLTEESEALAHVEQNLGAEFSRAVELIRESDGHLIVSGMGKSGLIGKKLAATFASTGTPSFFMHPVEAYHGDLGMIRGGEVILLISYSGRSEEIVRLLPVLRSLDVTIIGVVGDVNSPVARAADVVLDVSVKREACPHNLAPTSSATATLAMGDALAVVLMEEREFTAADFARRHPGGDLGRRLLCQVGDRMHPAPLPLVSVDAPLTAAMLEISRGRLGIALVEDADGEIVGHLRTEHIERRLAAGLGLDTPTSKVMGAPLPNIHANALIVEAEEKLAEVEAPGLTVMDSNGQIVGLFEPPGE